MDICYHDVRADEEKGRKAIENVHNHGASLEAKLMAQLRVQTLPKPVMLAAGLVIGSLDAKGFFQGDLASLGRAYQLGPADMEKGLALVQSFDPPGIAARDLREALLIQTRRARKAPRQAEALLEKHYDDFLQGKWQKIQASLGLSDSELRDIRDFFKSLSLQPASQIVQEEVYIRPDIEIYCDAKGQLTQRSLEDIPDVYFRDDLYDQYAARGDKEILDYIRKAAGILPIWPQPWLTAIIPSNRSWPASWTGRRTISCTIGLCGPCARRISLPTPSSVRRRSAASAATAMSCLKGGYIRSNLF